MSDKHWLSIFRDRFRTHWSTDCAWDTAKEAARYCTHVTQALGGNNKKTVQAVAIDEQTGKVAREIEMNRCANCVHWQPLKPYERLAEEVGHDFDQLNHQGTCAIVGVTVGPLRSTGHVYTHEDFLCVLHERKKGNE